jgi:hypothetical protein
MACEDIWFVWKSEHTLYLQELDRFSFHRLQHQLIIREQSEDMDREILPFGFWRDEEHSHSPLLTTFWAKIAKRGIFHAH